MSPLHPLRWAKKAILIGWSYPFMVLLGFLVVAQSFLHIGYFFENQPFFVERPFPLRKDLVSSALMRVVLLGGFIAAFLVGTAARASIVFTTNALEKKQKVGFRRSFRAIRRILVPLLAIEVFLSGFILSVLAVLVFPVLLLFSAGASTTGWIFLGGAITLFLPLFGILFFLRQYGRFYIILAELSFLGALFSGYKLLQKRWADSLVSGFCFVIMRLSFSVLIGFAVMGAVLLLFYSISVSRVSATVIGVGFVMLLSWYESFIQSIWTLFFRSIAKSDDPEIKALQDEQGVVKEKVAVGLDGV